MANLKTQAAAAAQGAVPTLGSINRQYGQSIGDVEGFTTALAHLLGTMPSAQGAYNTAIHEQGGINSAAQAALGATGTPYAAGSGGAVAGLGASALSNLNARGAAAGAYGATLPHVAAARGTLGVQSLESAKQNAIQTRADDFRQAYISALSQLRTQAEQTRQFNENLGLQNRQLSASESNDAANRAEQEREFNLSNAYRWAALGAQGSTGAKSGASAVAQALGLTPNEVQTRIDHAVSQLQGENPDTTRVPTYGIVNGQRQITGYRLVRVQGTGSRGAIEAGVPFPAAVSALVQQGIQPQIALLSAARLYRTAKPTNAYAWYTFVNWMAQHGSKQYEAVQRRMNGARSSGGSSTDRPPHPP